MDQNGAMFSVGIKVWFSLFKTGKHPHMSGNNNKTMMQASLAFQVFLRSELPSVLMGATLGLQALYLKKSY